jgi:hypothetical protein
MSRWELPARGHSWPLIDVKINIRSEFVFVRYGS